MQNHQHIPGNVDGLQTLLQCIEQARKAHLLSARELEQLACDFEHCNTAVVTWLASESIRKGAAHVHSNDRSTRHGNTVAGESRDQLTVASR